MDITNTTTGPKGVHTKTGLVYIEAGETLTGADLEDFEVASAKKTGWFSISDDAAPAADPATSEKPVDGATDPATSRGGK